MKINYFAEIYLIIISCYLTQTTAKCPSVEVLLPCRCESDEVREINETYYYIRCGGNDYYNLTNIFVKLSRALTEDEKHFKQIYFNNTGINEFVANVFYDITFEYISISSAYNLTQINPNAFHSTNGSVKQFSISDTPYGNTITHNNSIFNALNGLTNIEVIQFRNTSLTSIPSKAFGVLNKLHHLFFTDNSDLKSIGDNAFYELTNLTQLFFDSDSIESISDNAFSFRYTRYPPALSIVLLTDDKLRSDSFSNQTFASIGRPFTLRLYIGPQFKYLDKNIFGSSYMIAGVYNHIELVGYPLECDCRMYWLYENKDVYQSYIQNSKCSGDLKSVFEDRPAYNECKTN